MPAVQLLTRTAVDGKSPVAGSLQPGQLAIEMGTPTRLWVGVPVAQDANMQKLLLDSSTALTAPPSDGNTYGLKDGAWNQTLPLDTGGVVSGAITVKDTPPNFGGIYRMGIKLGDGTQNRSGILFHNNDATTPIFSISNYNDQLFFGLGTTAGISNTVLTIDPRMVMASQRLSATKGFSVSAGAVTLFLPTVAQAVNDVWNNNGVLNIGPGGPTPIADAPVDTFAYARKDAAWAQTMTKVDIDAADALLQSQVNLLASNLLFSGTILVVTDAGDYTAASGIADGVLPAASPTTANMYVIVTDGGVAAAGNIPAATYAPGDWIVCDGTAWIRMPVGQTTGAVAEAPVDTFTYGRVDAAWQKVLPLTGGLMNGDIVFLTLGLSDYNIQGKDAAAGSGVPGMPLRLKGGAGDGVASGGEFRGRGGDNAGPGFGGHAALEGGMGKNGGMVSLLGGFGSDGNGGTVAITGGNVSTLSTAANTTAGSVSIIGGKGDGSPTSKGGDILIAAGSGKAGSGVIHVQNLPTVAQTGDAIWNNAGVLNIGTGGPTPMADAPVDTFAYGRVDAAWQKVLPLTGGEMVGPITMMLGAPIRTPDSAALVTPLNIEGGTSTGTLVGAVNITAGGTGGAGFLGASVSISGGVASPVGGGGSALLVGGNANAGPGGGASLLGGTTATGSGGVASVSGGRGNTSGGNVSLTGGSANITPDAGRGGAAVLTGGYGNAEGGHVSITSGASDYIAGNVTIQGGRPNRANGTAGNITLIGGDVINSGQSGHVTLVGGPATVANSAPGDVTIQGGENSGSAATSGRVAILGGKVSGTATGSAGDVEIGVVLSDIATLTAGDLVLSPGINSVDATKHGRIFVENLPTVAQTDPNVLWNNGGALNLGAGAAAGGGMDEPTGAGAHGRTSTATWVSTLPLIGGRMSGPIIMGPSSNITGDGTSSLLIMRGGSPGGTGLGGTVAVIGGTGGGQGGQAQLSGGDGGAGFPGGKVSLLGGVGGSGGNGGMVQIEGGQSEGTGTTGGDVQIIAGVGLALGGPADGGNIELLGGVGSTGGNSGSVRLTGGPASQPAATAGDVVLTGGTNPTDTTKNGFIILQNLPTVAQTGEALWNNAGAINIGAGAAGGGGMAEPVGAGTWARLETGAWERGVATKGDTMTGNLLMSGTSQLQIGQTNSNLSFNAVESSVELRANGAIRFRTPANNFVVTTMAEVQREFVVNGNGGAGSSATLSLWAKAGFAAEIAGYTNFSRRWNLSLGDGTAETGASAGSNISLVRYDDFATPIGFPVFTVARATGVMDFDQAPTVQSAPIVMRDVFDALVARVAALEAAAA